MNRKQMISFAAGLATAFFSCKKEEPLLFNEGPSVFFSTSTFTSISGLYDTTNIFSEASLYGTNGTQTTNLYIHTVGLVSGVDRPVRLTLKQEGFPMEKGVHYDIKPDTIIIPAGKTMAAFSITRIVPLTAFPDLYDPALDNTLELQLVENDFFKLDKIKSANRTLIFRSGFMYYNPFSWINSLEVQDRLRSYSRKKVEVLALANKLNTDLLAKLKELGTIPAAADRFNAQFFYVFLNTPVPGSISAPVRYRLYLDAVESMVLYAKRYLEDQKTAGNTIMDENGVEVSF